MANMEILRDAHRHFRSVKTATSHRVGLGVPILTLLAAHFATSHSASAVERKVAPVQIVVSLTSQRLAAFRNGEQIFSSRVSTGKSGHRTPTGVFSILQKRRRHYSNIYRGAPMPFMQRLTWSGIALHGSGSVPRYPASHGCVRLPHANARKLFSLTRFGEHVVVTRQKIGAVKPRLVTFEDLFQPTSLSTLEFRGAHTEDQSSAQTTRGQQLVRLHNPDRLSDSQPLHYLASFKPVSGSDGNDTMFGLGDIEMEVDRRQVIQDRSRKPLRILIARRTKRQVVADVQRMLKIVGQEPGAPDGIVGKSTTAAIEAFEKDQGVAITGKISDKLIDALHEVTGLKRPLNGYLSIREDYKTILNVQVEISNPSRPLGTHLFTTTDFNNDGNRTRWTALTTDGTRMEVPRRAGVSVGQDVVFSAHSTAHEAVDRLKIPRFVYNFISDRLRPGSSMIIADNGFSFETGKYTDFIIDTR